MKKKVFFVIIVCLISLAVFAQESSDSFAEARTDRGSPVLIPDEEEEVIAEVEEVVEVVEAVVETVVETPDEMPGPATYHLLILDRIYSPLNSDINSEANISILYNFKHDSDGYLITIYKCADEGQVYPVLPAQSRIVVDLVTGQKDVIQDYVNNSSEFKRYVTHHTVLSDLKDLFETDW